MKVKKLKIYRKVVQMSKCFKYSDPEDNMSSLSSPVGDGMALNPPPEETVPQNMPQMTVAIEGQPNGTEESTEENEDDLEIPELTPIPDFHWIESAEEEEDLSSLPQLYPIPSQRPYNPFDPEE